MTNQSIKPINCQADAVFHFLEQMDAEMLNDILHDDRTYQDFQKDVFIQKLDGAFEVFKNAGDSLLSRHYGKCSEFGCNAGCEGFSFVGNMSGHYMDLIIEVKEGEVLDIYECLKFNDKACDIAKSSRVCIDKYNGVF
jgi:hypothetical protein